MQPLLEHYLGRLEHLLQMYDVLMLHDFQDVHLPFEQLHGRAPSLQ